MEGDIPLVAHLGLIDVLIHWFWTGLFEADYPKIVLDKLIQQSIAGFPLGTPPPTPRPAYACLQVGPGPETAMGHSIFPHMFGAPGLAGAPTPAPSGFPASWIKGGTHGRAY
jgi:hypothetical protein